MCVNSHQTEIPAPLLSAGCHASLPQPPARPCCWPATKSLRWPVGKLIDCTWWLKLLRNPWPDLVAAAYAWRDVLCDNRNLICNYAVFVCTSQPQRTGKCGRKSYSNIWAAVVKHVAAFPFKYNKGSHLQYEPQLIATLHILLVEHPVEFDDVGVVRKGFEDVVLRFDLLINVLKTKKTKVTVCPWLSSMCRCRDKQRI